MPATLLAFAVSVVLTGLVIGVVRPGSRFVLDRDITGPQKFHRDPVPRIGGIGVFCGLVAAVAALAWVGQPVARLAMLLLACAVPVFAAGLAEDLTKGVSPRTRLLAAAASAALALWLLGAQITRTDIPGLDALVSVAAGAALLTVLAVVGMANAVNIIDGFNGQASMCVVIMLAALACVAFQVQDSAVGALALIGIGAVLGFFLWNFPRGLIFLGDGGAYLLGFYVAELSILLLARNPGVSPLFPLLACIYPLFETLFSIYRRRVLRSGHACSADGIHLHSLIYRRMTRPALGRRSNRALTLRNSMTSPFLWLLCAVPAALAVLFWQNTALIAAAAALFALSYQVLYWRIVRFKSPRWMCLLRVPARASVQVGGRAHIAEAALRQETGKGLSTEI